MNRIVIHSKDERFTLADLSELCYNITNIYKILVFNKEKKKTIRYYYKAKLPEKDALFVDKISKFSPFSLEISSTITYGDILQTLVTILGIAIAMRYSRTNLDRRLLKGEIKEEIKIKLREKNIEPTEELVVEVEKLSRRKIRIEEIREE